MNVKRILAKLRKERLAIDRAIAALEKLETESSVMGQTAAERNPAREGQSLPSVENVIKFKPKKRAG